MLRRLLIVGVLIAAAVAAVWWYTRPQPVAVVLHTVGEGPVELIVANTKAGTVEAIRRAKLAPDTGGRVAVLNVKRGDRVEAGTVLLELWNEDLQAALALARSELQQAQARDQEARMLAEQGERDLKRTEELQASAIASEDVLEKARTEAEVRRAVAQAARVAVQVARDRVRVQEAAVERTRLRAPFAGIVAEVNCELGEFVTPSPVGIPTPPTVDLIEEHLLRVMAPIDEVDMRSVRPGQPVRITIDAYPGRPFPGTVARVAPYVTEREKEARTVEVEVHFASAEVAKDLLPGLSADVEIVLGAKERVLRVPTEAVLEGGKVLLAVERDGGLVLEERALTPGFKNWQWTEVASGVRPGERVVVSLDRAGVAAGAAVIAEAPAAGGAAATRPAHGR